MTAIGPPTSDDDATEPSAERSEGARRGSGEERIVAEREQERTDRIHRLNKHLLFWFFVLCVAAFIVYEISTVLSK